MDLGLEGLEAFVFGDPCSDVVEEVERDVDGAGLAFDLVAEVPGEVRLACAAAAGGLAAAFFDLGEGPSQDGPVRGHAGAAGVEHGADLGGVFGYAHGLSPARVASPHWM